MHQAGELLAVLFLAASSFLLGQVLGERVRGLLGSFAVRIVGALLTAAAAAALEASQVRFPTADVFPAFTYAPFALGWVFGGRDRHETAWAAVQDIVGLSALTLVVAGTGAGASTTRDVLHVALASLVLLGALLGAIVYAALASRVRPVLSVGLAVVGWAAFAFQVRSVAPPAFLALTLVPLLLLAASLSVCGRLATDAR